MPVIQLPTLAVRKLDSESLGPAAELLHKVWHETYLVRLPHSLRSQRTQAYFESYLEGRITQTWTAWMGKRIAGLASVSCNCVEDLWVAKRYRRRGIATRLVEEALEHMVGREYGFVQAGCEAFNGGAVGFFRAVGWKEIGREPLYLVPGSPIDAVVFSRSLDSHSDRVVPA